MLINCLPNYIISADLLDILKCVLNVISADVASPEFVTCIRLYLCAGPLSLLLNENCKSSCYY